MKMMSYKIRNNKKWMTATSTKMKDCMMLLMPINKRKIISRMWFKITKNNKKRKKKVKNKKTVVYPLLKNNFLKKHNCQCRLHCKQMMIIRSNKVTAMIFLMKIVMLMIRKKRVNLKMITRWVKNKKTNLKVTYLIDDYYYQVLINQIILN